MSPKLNITALTFLLPITTQAEIIVVGFDETTPPPGELGGYAMLPFPPDDRPLFEDVTSVPGPTGDVLFDRPLNHRRVGTGWAIWGHGYDGDLYFTMGEMELALTLPLGTGAFIVYASSNCWSDITATANDGTSLTQYTYWSEGADGWGFYTTGEPALTSISFSAEGCDFAIGEFSIAEVPEPTGLSLLAAGGLTLLLRRRGGSRRSRPAWARHDLRPKPPPPLPLGCESRWWALASAGARARAEPTSRRVGLILARSSGKKGERLAWRLLSRSAVDSYTGPAVLHIKGGPRRYENELACKCLDGGGGRGLVRPGARPTLRQR